MLAIASVYRDGFDAQAMRFQGKALRALQTSVKRGITDLENVQHIASNMLLCVLEVRIYSLYMWDITNAQAIKDFSKLEEFFAMALVSYWG